MNILRHELTDEKIKLGIESLFSHLAEINTSHVHVRLEQGLVILTGTVKTQKDKELLGSCLYLIDGVWEVDNRLLVKRPKKDPPISIKSNHDEVQE